MKLYDEPVFRNYCYCGNLKKMAGNAGYVNVIVGVIGIAATIITTVIAGIYNYKCADSVNCVPRFLQLKYLVFYFLLFSYALFTLISGFIFNKGFKNNDPRQMMPLLISRLFSCFVATAIPIVFDIFHIVFSTLPILLEIYTLLCLVSYYIILKRELSDGECKKIDIDIRRPEGEGV